ncbi:MAG: hypothetical protein AAF934_13045, partial [Bacteroidota bacterium]
WPVRQAFRSYSSPRSLGGIGTVGYPLLSLPEWSDGPNAISCNHIERELVLEHRLVSIDYDLRHYRSYGSTIGNPYCT